MVDAPMRREAFPIALMRYRQRRPASSTSVGELGMTRRISLVAACCSRRSRHNAVARLEFCEQPHVLDCNNVLVGKGLEKVDPTVRQRPFLQPGNARPPRPSDRGRGRSQEIERGGSAGGGTKPGRAGRCLHGVDPKWCAEMLYGASSMFLVHRARIAERAVNSRLPTVCVAPSYVRRGCLMSYSLNFQDLYRPAAYIVDKILKGAGGLGRVDGVVSLTRCGSPKPGRQTHRLLGSVARATESRRHCRSRDAADRSGAASHDNHSEVMSAVRGCARRWIRVYNSPTRRQISGLSVLFTGMAGELRAGPESLRGWCRSILELTGA